MDRKPVSIDLESARDFVPIKISVFSKGLSPEAFRLYCQLALACNPETGKTSNNVRAIASACGCWPHEIEMMAAELEDAKLVAVINWGDCCGDDEVFCAVVLDRCRMIDDCEYFPPELNVKING